MTWIVVHFDQWELARNKDRMPKRRSAETAITSLKMVVYLKTVVKNLCELSKQTKNS